MGVGSEGEAALTTVRSFGRAASCPARTFARAKYNIMA